MTERATMTEPAGLEIAPLTPERFADFEQLLGPRGGDGGCWCMFWRQTGAEHTANSGDGNRQALRRLAGGDPAPGLLAYRDGRAVGWCSVGPRTDFGRIGRSRRYRPLEPDDRPVWSVVCFYIAQDARGGGVAAALLDAAADYARAHGATLLEGYPTDTGGERVPPVNAYTGVLSLFEKAGYTEVERRVPGSPIVRRDLSSST